MYTRYVVNRGVLSSSSPHPSCTRTRDLSKGSKRSKDEIRNVTAELRVNDEFYLFIFFFFYEHYYNKRRKRNVTIFALPTQPNRVAFKGKGAIVSGWQILYYLGKAANFSKQRIQGRFLHLFTERGALYGRNDII